MPDVTGVIERLRKATGPDRGLDCHLHAVMYPVYADMKATPEGFLVGGDHEQPVTANDYTSSIDAALTLVPEEDSSNFEVSLEQSKRKTRTYWTATIGHMHLDAWTGKSPTPAIALCIAALQARAALLGDGK